MDYMLAIKFQLASLAFILMITIDFMRSKHTRLLTNRVFTALLFTTHIDLLLEIGTLYTIRYMTDSVWNEIVHKAFYIAMLSCIFGFSAYVEVAGNARNSNINMVEGIIWPLPYLISVVGILLFDVKYVVDEKGVYSYGLSAVILVIGILFYAILLFIETFRYKEMISPKRRFALRLQLFIWLVVIIYQRIDPYNFFASLGISLSVVALFLSFENPNELIDEETGVFNRKAFSQVFYEKNNCITTIDTYLVACVIDDMEILVSSIGYYRVEQVMKQIAAMLKTICGKSVYRNKMHIFTIIIPTSDPDFEEKLQRLEQAMEDTIEVDGAKLTIKSHVVIMECPKITKEPTEVYELIQCGTEYGGTGFIRRIDEDIVEKKQREDTLKRMLIDAIENDGFQVVYQPIYSVKHKGFVSAEALVRLKDNKTIGFVSPEEFIPLAENNGFVIKLGEIVFEKVCQTLQQIKQQNIPLEYIEVNLSALQGIDEEVPGIFSRLMEQYGIKPQEINLEITETTVVESSFLLDRNMNEFRRMGCSFSMDDFGTGYSNLSQMAEVQYDLIKIDKSLIWACYGEQKNEKAQTILKNVVHMVTALGPHIVAEGVETAEMAQDLEAMGVQYMQGYYYSKPISKEDYMAFLIKQNTGCN